MTRIFALLIALIISHSAFAQAVENDTDKVITDQGKTVEQPELNKTPEEPEAIKPENETAEGKVDPEYVPMTLARMHEIVKSLDENAVINDRVMQLTVSGISVVIITSPNSNRMRAIAPVRSLDGVDNQDLYRMLQANFDSALDARYSIAKGQIVSAFIHPLKELDKNELISGIGQVVNLVLSYGTTYTSGAMTFGGGDSRQLHRKLIEDLLKKGEEI
ncbi:MAG: hypothetical protein AAGF54_01030 [Pseudomonadota bacterium]